MEVPSAVLQKLVCENCDGYLSRGPIYLMRNVKYRCGRCLPSEEEQGTRLEAYEKLAKLMLFPCRYRKNGCLSKVPFVENEAHEDGCPYREYICPIVESHCGSSTSNTLTDHTTQAKTLEVQCIKCDTLTEPVYRQGWLCKIHAPEPIPCIYSSEGCTHLDIIKKCAKNESYFCEYNYRCWICPGTIYGRTLDSHYTEHHADIIHKTGTVFPVWPWSYLLIVCDFGKAFCQFKRRDDDFELQVNTPVPSTELYKYRCTVEISHPDTGHTLTCTTILRYDKWHDWHVYLSRNDFNLYSRDNKMNMKIDIYKISDPSEFIL